MPAVGSCQTVDVPSMLGLYTTPAGAAPLAPCATSWAGAEAAGSEVDGIGHGGRNAYDRDFAGAFTSMALRYESCSSMNSTVIYGMSALTHTW